MDIGAEAQLGRKLVKSITEPKMRIIIELIDTRKKIEKGKLSTICIYLRRHPWK